MESKINHSVNSQFYKGIYKFMRPIVRSKTFNIHLKREKSIQSHSIIKLIKNSKSNLKTKLVYFIKNSIKQLRKRQTFIQKSIDFPINVKRNNHHKNYNLLNKTTFNPSLTREKSNKKSLSPKIVDLSLNLNNKKNPELNQFRLGDYISNMRSHYSDAIISKKQSISKLNDEDKYITKTKNFGEFKEYDDCLLPSIFRSKINHPNFNLKKYLFVNIEVKSKP